MMNAEKIVKTFKELTKKDVRTAGGKGASLGEMTNAGFPVPDGFVLLTGAFTRFLEETEIHEDVVTHLASVRHDEIASIEEASREIQAIIQSQEIPEDIREKILKYFRKLNVRYVAVRSSATAEDGSVDAWAGQLDSIINTTKKELFNNIKKCWASLYSPRAIFYRHEKGLENHSIGLAVVIQKMVNSEVSGVGFSVHPITQDPNQLAIEAVFGLGEATVSGQVTPDSYVVEKHPLKIIERRVETQRRGLFHSYKKGKSWKGISVSKGSEQALTDNQIIRLSKLLIRIEKHYRFPVDVEWVKHGGSIFIVQSRPITTLGRKRQKQQKYRAGNQKHIQEYVRLFRITDKGLPMLFSDIFAQHYKKLSCYLTAVNGAWTSYLPQQIVQITLHEGERMYSTQKEFTKFRRNFDEYIARSEHVLKKLLAKSSYNKREAQNFLFTAAEIFEHYSKTEFFYTDLAFQSKLKTPSKTLNKNIKKLELLKNNGRSHLNKVLFHPSYVMLFLKKLEAQFKISKKDLQQYKIQEVLDLFSGAKVSKKNLQKRKAAFTMVSDGNRLHYTQGARAKEEIKKFLLTSKSNSQSLRGVSAHAGKVTGRIRIIPANYYLDFGKLGIMMAKMKKGEILVAETTSPEMMPACKKAAAILTDQGGLLSHAAIVSRELDVPCIVQIPNGTEVLRNGELVEVDANIGVVRRLKG